LGDLVTLIQYTLLSEFAVPVAGRLYRPNSGQPVKRKRPGDHGRYHPSAPLALTSGSPPNGYRTVLALSA